MGGVQLLRFIASLFFGMILILQVSATIQTSRFATGNDYNIFQLSSAQVGNSIKTDNTNVTSTSSRSDGCSYRETLKKFSESTVSLDDWQIANSGFLAGLHSAETDYKNGNGFTLNFSTIYHDSLRGNNKLTTISYQHGYLCGYGPPESENNLQQPQQPETEDKTLCPAEDALTKTSFMPKTNIKKVSYVPPNYPKRSQNDIITVQSTGSDAVTNSLQNAGPYFFDRDPWKFKYEVVDREGLVITNLNAGDQSVLKSLSVPHFKIKSITGVEEIVRFNKATDAWCSLEQAKSIDGERSGINWGFKHEIKKPGLTGILNINYSIVIWNWHKNNCEMGAGFNCYRFVPKLNFSWTSPDASNSKTGPFGTSDLYEFTAFYKLDYGNVGFALTKDRDNFPSFLVNNLYRQDILTNETKIYAVNQGVAGDYDNIHTVHEGQSVIIPGCGRSSWLGALTAAFKVRTEYNAFDCVHMHWRWSESTHPMQVDPMVEPSDNRILQGTGLTGLGKPNLVPGQTIQIGILRVDGSTSKDPDDPLSLIDVANPKRIATLPKLLDDATATAGNLQQYNAPNNKVLKSLTDENGNPVSTVLWYVASGKYVIRKEVQDTFFRHGIFVIDPKTTRQELETIRSNLEGAALPSDEDMKTQVIAQLDSVLANSAWSADGNMLVADRAGNAFTALSAIASSLVEISSDSADPSQRLVINKALNDLLSATQHIVNTDLQSKIVNTLTFAPKQEGTLQRLFAENQAIGEAVEKYISASNVSDLANSPKIIDDFKESWLGGVKGIEQVSTQLGVTQPSTSSSNTSLTGSGQKLQNSTSQPKSESSNNVTQPLSFNDLSGIWSADDGGTYYLKQLGNVLWWLGLSGNDGQSFTNIFKGIVKDNNIEGEWADVPKGATRNHGGLTLNITNNFSTGMQLHKISETGGFAGSVWTLREGESMSSIGETTTGASQNTQSTAQTGVQENKSITAFGITESEGTGVQMIPTNDSKDTPGLIAWWPGMTSNNLLVDIVGGHNGTANNIWPRSMFDLNTPGKVGEGIKLNAGNNSLQEFIIADHNNSFDITATDALTIDAWINPIAGGSIIFDKVEAAGNPFANYRFVLGEPDKPEDRRIGFWNGSLYVYSQKSVPLNEFSNVAVTWKDGTVKFYIDGKFDSAQQIAIGPVNTLNEVIGPFSGVVDELKFFNKELSPDQINTISSIEPPQTGTIEPMS